MLACFLFWWLPSILFRILGMRDPVHGWAFSVSIVSLALFGVGYHKSRIGSHAAFQPLLRVPPVKFSTSTLDACESLSYSATLLVAIPALVLSVQFFVYRLNIEYGQGEGIPLAYQVVLYIHLFLGFLFLGVAKTEPKNRARLLFASILIVLPRLIISLRWGRFFFAQAAIPILFIASARGWLRLRGKRVILLGFLGGFLVFVPALTRGDYFWGQDGLLNFFAAGGSLRLFQDNAQLNLAGRCPPLLVSLSDKTIPYESIGLCTMRYQGTSGWPATLDRILTENDPAAEGTLYGTGSNYLLELYLTGGVAAVAVGSVVFGFTCRCFVSWIGRRSAFAGIWAECLSRALFAPRGNLGYVYERIPSLALATLFALWLAWLANARIAKLDRRKPEAVWQP